jgi:hypothetical protein
MSEQPTGGAHFCGTCGKIHDDGQDAQVRIERIRADRDVRVAEIQRSETRAVVETGAETEVAVAEIGAAAGIEETAALAEGIAASGDSGDPPPAVMTDVPAPDAEPEVQSIAARDDETGDDIDAEASPDGAKGKLSYWP